MHSRHWSDEEILADLYGVGPVDRSPHECADCRQRREWVRRRQEELRAAPELSETFLAAQRQAIMARAQGRPRFSGWRLVPGLAAVVLLLLTILVIRPVPKIQPAPEPDAQLLEDVFSIVARSEPRAVEPVRGLFQVNQ